MIIFSPFRKVFVHFNAKLRFFLTFHRTVETKKFLDVLYYITYTRIYCFALRSHYFVFKRTFQQFTPSFTHVPLTTFQSKNSQNFHNNICIWGSSNSILIRFKPTRTVYRQRDQGKAYTEGVTRVS